MIAPEPNPARTSDDDAVLDDLRHKLARLTAEPGLGGNAIGVPEWDRELWSLGRKWIESNSGKLAQSGNKPAERVNDVYLATQVAADGGHTALIGDFVRALADEPGTSPHLILTNLVGENPPPLAESIRERTGIAASNIIVLRDGSLGERMEQLFACLLALQPKRLFLFQHPVDPLAAVVAQPEISPERYLVHFADAMPTFGLYLPGVRVVDLNPVASAMSRQIGLDPASLPLTAPDPGPRPAGFLQRGKLVTATSGRPEKFSAPYSLSYPDTVGVVLRSTGGWHVHIGRLEDAMLLRIREVLGRAGLPQDRFIHVPWAGSVAKALWEHQCDVYLSSFPVDGARTNAEVLASATPHLRHSASSGRKDSSPTYPIEGGSLWHSWEDLTSILHELSDSALLEAKSRLMRANYESLHHPRIFAERLADILAGGRGWEDPLAHERDHRALSRMLRSLATQLIHRTDEVKKQEKRIDFLQGQRKRSEERIARLETERDQRLKGRSLRAKFLRWLSGD
jgi:hypothetical protein